MISLSPSNTQKIEKNLDKLNNKSQIIVNEEYLPHNSANKNLSGLVFYVEYSRNWIKTIILNNKKLLKWILITLLIFGYHVFLSNFFLIKLNCKSLFG